MDMLNKLFQKKRSNQCQSAGLLREKNVGTNGAEGKQNLDNQRTACAYTTNEGLAWQKIHVPMMGLILQVLEAICYFSLKSYGRNVSKINSGSKMQGGLTYRQTGT